MDDSPTTTPDIESTVRDLIIELAAALMNHSADCCDCQHLIDRLEQFGIEL